MIQVNALRKQYLDGNQSKLVLDGLDFYAQTGQSVAITGDSGSGKSTLLHLLAALDQADAGEILVQGLALDTFNEKQADHFRKHNIGMVFQRFNLIDCLSVWDNVCLPARLSGKADFSHIERLLAVLGIEAQRHKLPVDLSGGEQQRVAIARALAHQPPLVLADEPTGNLDNKNSERVAELLFDLCKSFNTTLVLVTHNQALAAGAERHLHLANGQLRPC